MGEDCIIAPIGADDTEGAKRVFEAFLTEYQPVFTQIERHLDKIMEAVPIYAEAYLPWHKALREVSRGIYLTTKNIGLPNPKAFLDALTMFSFEGSVNFLQDLCISCKIEIQRNWAERFRKHVEMLLTALAILNRHKEAQITR